MTYWRILRWLSSLAALVLITAALVIVSRPLSDGRTSSDEQKSTAGLPSIRKLTFPRAAD